MGNSDKTDAGKGTLPPGIYIFVSKENALVAVKQKDVPPVITDHVAQIEAAKKGVEEFTYFG